MLARLTFDDSALVEVVFSMISGSDMMVWRKR